MLGVAVIVALPPTQIEGLFTTTLDTAFTVNNPLPLPTQPFASSMITLYAPATSEVKLATFPGSVTPVGTVHA